MNTSAMLGGVLGVGAVICGVLLGTSLVIFFDVYSVMLWVMLVLGFLLQAYGTAGLGELLRASRCWLKGGSYSADSGIDMRGLIAQSSRATMLAAKVLMLVGGIQICRHATDFTEIGPAVGVMLLPLFYAYCFDLFYWGPLDGWLGEQSPA